jgi:hypothetical protein
MCWQYDFDYVRVKLAEDIRATRKRGTVSARVRMAAWAAIAILLVMAEVPVAALPAIVVFEAFVAPRIARPPARRLGRLIEWRPPESVQESPEAPAHLSSKDL